MKNLLLTALTATLMSGPLMAQDAASQLPEGAMKPANLNALGSSMRDRMSEIIGGDADTGQVSSSEAEADSLSLFSGGRGEDPNILEIKKIARELESQRALMIQISGLQKDLIDFAMADPAAAHQSRIPSHVCEYALEKRFCDAMNGSFQPRVITIIKE